MAYLGRGIENLSDRVVLDSLTASATADYTLQLNSVNFVPSSAESLTVSLNGVIQAPGSSYTVSSSTLSFSSALTSSDSIDFIIAERGITLQTPSAGSVNTDQLASTAVTPAKMDLSQDYTFTGKVSGHNLPTFRANSSTDQTGVSDNTWTQVNYANEDFDTDSGFASNQYTISTAGKYFFYASARILAASATNYLERGFLRILRTRSSTDTSISFGGVDWRNNPGYVITVKTTSVLECQVGDVYKVQIFGDVTSGNVTIASNADNAYFGAYRIGD